MTDQPTGHLDPEKTNPLDPEVDVAEMPDVECDPDLNEPEGDENVDN